MNHHLVVCLLCLFSASLCAQMARLQSGCWQNAEGRLFNCYADSFQVAIMSLSETDKLFFEGRWRAKGQIEGQLLHVDFRTNRHTRTRATLTQKNRHRLEVVAGGVPGSGFFPGKGLRFTAPSTRYLPLAQPIFDERWRAWERKNWFQFADTLVQIFRVSDIAIAHYEKTVLYPNGTGQGIRYRFMEYGCQNREKVQYTVQKNGEIRFKLAHMDNACDGYVGLSAQGTIRSNFSVDGFIGPNDDMPPEPQRWRIPELKNLGLTGWWPADRHCRDLVTGVAGTLVGGTAYTPGRFGHAFSLDGLNDHVDFPHNPAHQPSRITVLAWIKGRRSTLDPDFLVVDTQHAFGDQCGWVIQGGNQQGGLGLGYGVLGKEEFQGVNGKRDVLDNRWHLIAGTFDGVLFKWYVDGELDSTGQLKGQPAPSDRGLRIGCSRIFTRHFLGLVDELAIFNRALRVEEIERVYAGGIPALLDKNALKPASENPSAPADVELLPRAFSLIEVVVNNRRVAIEEGYTAARPLVLKSPMLSLNIRVSKNEQGGGYYRLVGLDSVSRPLPPDLTIVRPGLPVGNYVLRVTRFLQEGMTDELEEILEVPIRVEGTPSGVLWWAAGVLVFLAATAWFWQRERRKRRRERQHLHRRLSRDLHDDLGSSLSSIALSSRLVGQEHPESMRDALDRIAEEARQASGLVKDLVWSVNPENESMEEVLVRIRHFAAELFEDSDTAWQAEIGPEISGIVLAPEARRHVYLIAKEALNNAAKYAGASDVCIHLYREGKKLVLEVADNGRGFDPAAAQHGNGLNNMAARAALLGGVLRVDSIPGQGTQVRVVFAG